MDTTIEKKVQHTLEVITDRLQHVERYGNGVTSFIHAVETDPNVAKRVLGALGPLLPKQEDPTVLANRLIKLEESTQALLKRNEELEARSSGLEAILTQHSELLDDVVDKVTAPPRNDIASLIDREREAWLSEPQARASTSNEEFNKPLEKVKRSPPLEPKNEECTPEHMLAVIVRYINFVRCHWRNVLDAKRISHDSKSDQLITVPIKDLNRRWKNVFGLIEAYRRLTNTQKYKKFVDDIAVAFTPKDDVDEVEMTEQQAVTFLEALHKYACGFELMGLMPGYFDQKPGELPIPGIPYCGEPTPQYRRFAANYIYATFFGWIKRRVVLATKGDYLRVMTVTETASTELKNTVMPEITQVLAELRIKSGYNDCTYMDRSWRLLSLADKLYGKEQVLYCDMAELAISVLGVVFELVTKRNYNRCYVPYFLLHHYEMQEFGIALLIQYYYERNILGTSGQLNMTNSQVIKAIVRKRNEMHQSDCHDMKVYFAIKDLVHKRDQESLDRLKSALTFVPPDSPIVTHMKTVPLETMGNTKLNKYARQFYHKCIFKTFSFKPLVPYNFGSAFDVARVRAIAFELETSGNTPPTRKRDYVLEVMSTSILPTVSVLRKSLTEILHDSKFDDNEKGMIMRNMAEQLREWISNSGHGTPDGDRDMDNLTAPLDKTVVALIRKSKFYSDGVVLFNKCAHRELVCMAKRSAIDATLYAPWRSAYAVCRALDKAYSDTLYMEGAKMPLNKFFIILDAVYEAMAFIVNVVYNNPDKVHTAKSIAAYRALHWWGEATKDQSSLQEEYFLGDDAMLLRVSSIYNKYPFNDFEDRKMIKTADYLSLFQELNKRSNMIIFPSKYKEHFTLLITALRCVIASGDRQSEKVAIARAYISAVLRVVESHWIKNELRELRDLLLTDNRVAIDKIIENFVSRVPVHGEEIVCTPERQAELVSDARSTLMNVVLVFIKYVVGYNPSSKDFYVNGSAILGYLPAQIDIARNTLADLEVQAPRFAPEHFLSYFEAQAAILTKSFTSNAIKFEAVTTFVKHVLNYLTRIEMAHTARPANVYAVEQTYLHDLWSSFFLTGKPDSTIHFPINVFKTIDILSRVCSAEGLLALYEKFQRGFTFTPIGNEYIICQRDMESWLQSLLVNHHAAFYHHLQVLSFTLMKWLNKPQPALLLRVNEFLLNTQFLAIKSVEINLINDMLKWYGTATKAEVLKAVEAIGKLIPDPLPDYTLNVKWWTFYLEVYRTKFIEFLNELLKVNRHEDHATYRFEERTLQQLIAFKCDHKAIMISAAQAVPDFIETGAMEMFDEAWSMFKLDFDTQATILPQRIYRKFLHLVMRTFYHLEKTLPSFVFNEAQYFAKQAHQFWSNFGTSITHGQMGLAMVFPGPVMSNIPLRFYHLKQLVLENMADQKNGSFLVPAHSLKELRICLKSAMKDESTMNRAMWTGSVCDIIFQILNKEMFRIGITDKNLVDVTYTYLATSDLQFYFDELREYGRNTDDPTRFVLFSDMILETPLKLTPAQLRIIFERMTDLDAFISRHDPLICFINRFLRIYSDVTSFNKRVWSKVLDLYFECGQRYGYTGAPTEYRFQGDKLHAFFNRMLASRPRTPPDVGVVRFVKVESENLKLQGYGIGEMNPSSSSSNTHGHCGRTFHVDHVFSDEINFMKPPSVIFTNPKPIVDWENSTMRHFAASYIITDDPVTTESVVCKDDGTLEMVPSATKTANTLNQGTAKTGMSANIPLIKDDDDMPKPELVEDMDAMQLMSFDPNDPTHHARPYPYGGATGERSFYDRFMDAQNAAINIAARMVAKRTLEQMQNNVIYRAPASSSTSSSNDVIAKLSSEITEIKSMLKTLTDRVTKVEHEVDPVPDLVNRMAQAEDNYTQLDTLTQDLKTHVLTNTEDIALLDDIVTEFTAKLPELEKTIASLGSRPSEVEESHIQKKARRYMEEE